MMETLEGKKAGLQNAVALREENAQIRRREDDMFRKMAEKQNHDGAYFKFYCIFDSLNAFYFTQLQKVTRFVIEKRGVVPNTTETAKKIANNRNVMPNGKRCTIVGVPA